VLPRAYLLLIFLLMTQHTTQQSIRSCSLAIILVSFAVLGTLVAITRANAQEAESASSAAEENTATPVPARAVRQEAVQERRDVREGQYETLPVLSSENQEQRQADATKRREQAQATMEARRAEIEAALAERQAEKEVRVAEWQARAEERKARLAENAQQRLRDRVARIEERLQAVVMRLRDAKQRIEDRITLVEEQRGTVEDVARGYLGEVDVYMNAIETVIAGLPDLADVVLASDDPRAGMEEVRAALGQIRGDIEGVRGTLRSALESLALNVPTNI
jgi:chromosome segregation ATPase